MSKNENSKFIKQLFGSYFHQDWPLEHDDWQGVVAEMCASEPASSIQGTIADISTVLEHPLSDENLRAYLLNDIGCYFEPESQGLTCREWLEQMKVILMRCKAG